MTAPECPPAGELGKDVFAEELEEVVLDALEREESELLRVGEGCVQHEHLARLQGQRRRKLPVLPLAFGALEEEPAESVRRPDGHVEGFLAQERRLLRNLHVL